MNAKEREDLFQKGARLYEEKKCREALSCFSKLFETDPHNFEVQLYFGLIKMRLGDPKSALVNLCKAECLLPASGLGLEIKAEIKSLLCFKRACCCHQMGDYKKASEMFLKQIKKILDHA